MKTAVTLGISVALALAGCSADYVEDSQASVLLIVAAVSVNGNAGAVLESDIRRGADSSIICADFVTLDVAVRHKNPGALSPSVPNAVLIERYEVRYFRSDGRGAEGVDVPFRITGNISTAIDVADAGTSEVPIEVVRRQAKLEPPLSSISGFDVVTVFAEITIHGRTVSGDGVAASGRLQIDFADYGDSESGCPEQ